MNLPKAITNMKEMMEPDVAAFDDHPVSAALVSKKVLDVEYEDDYEGENLFNGIASLALQNPVEEKKDEVAEVRDYSIDSWNGSPGLKHWGYDGDDPAR